jgi:hypothetical protein
VLLPWWGTIVVTTVRRLLLLIWTSRWGCILLLLVVPLLWVGSLLGRCAPTWLLLLLLGIGIRALLVYYRWLICAHAGRLLLGPEPVHSVARM